MGYWPDSSIVVLDNQTAHVPTLLARKEKNYALLWFKDLGASLRGWQQMAAQMDSFEPVIEPIMQLPSAAAQVPSESLQDIAPSTSTDYCSS